jgi:uncharacterized YccA/Bax inhibitor family protein
MRSGNPALTATTFNKYQGVAGPNQMTLSGTVNKTFLLLFLVIASAIFTWSLYFEGGNVTPFLLGGVIGGLILALITIFVPKVSPITTPIYAILEGFVVGGISAMYEVQFAGITLQAVLLTFSILIALLLAYKSGLIRATENFKLGVTAATFGIFLVYMLSFVLGFFGMEVPYLHSNGLIGIGISLFIVVIASLNLVLDFDFIETGVERQAPKYMEWYAAFGLLVTLIWLYFEVLRLLAKLRSRD